MGVGSGWSYDRYLRRGKGRDRPGCDVAFGWVELLRYSGRSIGLIQQKRRGVADQEWERQRFFEARNPWIERQRHRRASFEPTLHDQRSLKAAQNHPCPARHAADLGGFVLQRPQVEPLQQRMRLLHP